MSYRTVHKHFWTDADMRSLPKDARYIAQFLQTGPPANMIGCMFMPTLQIVDYVYPFELENNTVSDTVPDTVSDTVLPTLMEMVDRGCQHLERIGYIRRCAKTKWIWIVDYMNDNPIQNPSAGMAAMKLIKEIPKDATFYRDIILNFLNFSQQEHDPKKQRINVSQLKELLALGEDKGEDLTDAAHGVRHGVGHGDSREDQDQDQDQELERGSANADSSSGADDSKSPPDLPVLPFDDLGSNQADEAQPEQPPPKINPVQTVDSEHDPPSVAFEIWHEVIGGSLPVPKSLDRDRRRKLERRLRDSFGNDLERWRDYCGRIRGSPHLTGDNPRNWLASFDWCLEPKNLRKIIEGNYDGPRTDVGGLAAVSGVKPSGVAASHDATIAELRRRRAAAG